MQDDRAFEELLAKVIDFMNREALTFPERYTGLLGSKLEDKVVEVLQQCAVGTCFEDQIVKYSGQRFPDIVIGGYYGVEVKTTKAIGSRGNPLSSLFGRYEFIKRRNNF